MLEEAEDRSSVSYNCQEMNSLTLGTLLTDYPRAAIYISLAIALPSLFIYLAEIVVLFRYRHRPFFDTAFYHLFLTRAFISIVNYVNHWMGIRFGRLGIFYSLFDAAGSWLLAIIWFFH